MVVVNQDRIRFLLILSLPPQPDDKIMWEVSPILASPDSEIYTNEPNLVRNERRNKASFLLNLVL